MKPILDINHKQAELINYLFEQVHARFPGISQQGLGCNPEDKEHIFLYVLSYLDENEEIEMMHYAGALEADILLDTGYYISIIPRLPVLQEA